MIIEELDWVDARLAEIKKDIDVKSYSKIEDRVISLVNGEKLIEKVVATEEAQKEAIRKSLREYLLLLESADKLRSQEDAKIAARGNTVVNTQMNNLIKG